MIKRLIPILVLIPAFLVIMPLSASAAGDTGSMNVQKLLQTHGCSACHAATTLRVGPPWSWIAWRYKNKPAKTSLDAIAQFIITGGKGNWTKWTHGVTMPAHPKLSREQARAIAKWIVSQPPAKPPKPGH